MKARRLICLILVLLAGSEKSTCAGDLRRKADQIPVYTCEFGLEHDNNYDTWPDGWQRQTDAEFPHYVDIQIAEDPTAVAGRALKVSLDGSSARFSTPPIPILPKFSYKVQYSLKTQDLQHSLVYVFAELYNDDGELVETIRSEPYQSTDGWVHSELDAFRPKSTRVASAVLRFEIRKGRRGDLQGKVLIDDIWMARLPSMVVTTDSALNVYENPDDVAIICQLSGIKEQNPIIRFQLLDATRYIVGDNEGDHERLPTRLIEQDSRSARDIVGVGDSKRASYEGRYVWDPPITGSGYYKIRVQMLSSDESQKLSDEERELYHREISVVVLPEGIAKSKHGEFGWAMPLRDWPLTRDEVSQLVQHAGIHWLKTPVWFDPDHPEQGESIIQFAERLAASEVEVVGLIEDPTIKQTRSQDGAKASHISSLLLADKSVWQPLYDHVMARLSLRIRWWQLGSDGDYSLKDFPDLPRKVADIRRGLFRFGQDAKVGLGWRWPLKHELEKMENEGGTTDKFVELSPSWEFEQFVAKDPLAAPQLTDMLEQMPRTSALRWVNIELPPEFALPDVLDVPEDQRNDESLRSSVDSKLRIRHENRIREFVRQILAAKRNGVDGIFISNLFTNADGVMNKDGTPGELFLPWRTAASVLGGAKYLGKLQLQHDSHNFVFVREDGELVMVLWNDTPTTETLYLGESLQQLDVWGNRTTPAADGHRSSVQVGRLPVYIIGLNAAVARWRMAVKFQDNHIPSIFAEDHPNALSIANHFRQGVGGTARIEVPRSALAQGESLPSLAEKWRVTPQQSELRLGAGERAQIPFHIYLDEATYGEQPVRIDFKVEADRQYVFSVWRMLHVGLGDIEIDIKSRLDSGGRLIVEQWMSNSSSIPADFKCLLYLPPRRRKRSQVFMLGAEGDKKEYIYENGQELLGRELKLRAEEVNGQRVLIHRFIAGE